MTDVTIYHNPRCSKSRKTLAILEARGVRPTIVRYLDTPPDANRLRAVIAALGIEPRALLRTGEAVCSELGLDDPSVDDDALIAAMCAHPILIQRPIVVTADGRARIGRPPEAVLTIL